MLEVSLFSCQTVRLQEEGWGVVFKVSLGGSCGGEVGGDAESITPDPGVLARGVEGLGRGREEQQPRQYRLHNRRLKVSK